MMNSIAWTGDPMMTPEIRARLPLGPIERANLVRSVEAALDRVRALEVEREQALSSANRADALARQRGLRVGEQRREIDALEHELAEMTRWRDEALKEAEERTAERAEARDVAVKAITVNNLDVPLARKLGQALGSIRDVFFAGGAGRTADAALRSLSPEECQILGVTAAPRRPEAPATCPTCKAPLTAELVGDRCGYCDPSRPDGVTPEEWLARVRTVPNLRGPEPVPSPMPRVAIVNPDGSIPGLESQGEPFPAPRRTYPLHPACAACGAPACAEFGIKVDGVARPLCADCGDLSGTRLGTPARAWAEFGVRRQIRARDNQPGIERGRS